MTTDLNIVYTYVHEKYCSLEVLGRNHASYIINYSLHEWKEVDRRAVIKLAEVSIV